MLVLERKVGDSLTVTTPDGVVLEVKLVRMVNNNRAEIGIGRAAGLEDQPGRARLGDC